MQPEHNRFRFFHNPKILILALAVAVLLTATAGTMAWLRYVRSLQTVTLIHVSDLYLLGPDGTNTGALNLGSIDVSTAGSKTYAFGIKSNLEKYRFQLAYTTNIPFSYSIHRATATQDNTYTTAHTEGGITFYYDTKAVTGHFLNLNRPDDRIADNTRHPITYNEYSNVQKYAEPVYWQSSDVDRVDTIDYYILEVTWTESLPNNKETDMIYLTVGAPVGGSGQ